MKSFPCPWCKGKYQDTDYIDGYTIVLGECNTCDYGMIEVGSPKHMDLKRNAVTRKAIELFGQDGDEYSYDRYKAIGLAIEQAVKDSSK